MTKEEKNIFIKKMIGNAFQIDFHKDNEENQKRCISWFLARATLYEELTGDFETIKQICISNNIKFILDRYF